MDIKSLAAVRFQFAQSVFSHKIQEKAADRKYEYAKWFKIIQLILTLFVIAVLVAQAAGFNNSFVNIVGIISAGIEIAFIIIDLTYGFEKQAAIHKSYALKYLELRNKLTAVTGRTDPIVVAAGHVGRIESGPPALRSSTAANV